MPYKFNDAGRDKFSKAKYRVTNCTEYNESLRRRGDVTICVSDDVVQNWAKRSTALQVSVVQNMNASSEVIGYGANSAQS